MTLKLLPTVLSKIHRDIIFDSIVVSIVISLAMHPEVGNRILYMMLARLVYQLLMITLNAVLNF